MGCSSSLLHHSTIKDGLRHWRWVGVEISRGMHLELAKCVTALKNYAWADIFRSLDFSHGYERKL